MVVDPSIKSRPNVIIDDNLGFAKVGPWGGGWRRMKEGGGALSSCPFHLRLQLTKPEADGRLPTSPSLPRHVRMSLPHPRPTLQDRSISRLLEMQSLEYLVAFAERHAPDTTLALREGSQRKKFWLQPHRKESKG